MAGKVADKQKRKRPSRYARPFRVETDPHVEPADPCIVCGKGRTRIAVAHGDPFCLRPCCEKWYALPGPTPGGAA